MPQPKSKISRSRRGMRRSHDGLKTASPSTCPECSATVRPHRACPECGFYKGKLVSPSN